MKNIMFTKHHSIERLVGGEKINKRLLLEHQQQNNQHRQLQQSSSPYSIQYKPNLTHDQRELLSHRQYACKLQRSELEDRYLALLDENFTIKKENLCNHDKIRKLVTKLLRLSNGGGGGGGGAGVVNGILNDNKRYRVASASSIGATGTNAIMKQKLTNEENLQIKIIDLESYIAQLKEKLNTVIKHYNLNKRSSSAATIRGSTSSLLRKSKIYKSHDEMPFDLPFSRPETRNSRLLFGDTNDDSNQTIDNREKAICDEPAISNEVNDLKVQEQEIKELRDIIEKLQKELTDEKNQNDYNADTKKQLDKELFDKLMEKKQIENLEMKKKLQECDAEIVRLNRECKNVRKINENVIEAERSRIFELTAVLEKEVLKNKQLIEQKEALEEEVITADILKQETSEIMSENELLRKHRENISSLATELATRNETIKQFKKQNDDLLRELEESKANVAALEHCQKDLIQKIQTLQDMNDSLTVQIEGFKAECLCLMERNASLLKEHAVL